MSIENHDWFDEEISVANPCCEVAIRLNVDIRNSNYSYIDFDKDDVIAIAQEVKLTAEDINCPMLKAKQEELNEADVRHFDEVAELELKVRNLESRLKLRGCN